MTQDATTTVERIARFATRVDRATLSDEAADRLKRILLDTLGCAIGALGAGPVVAVRNVVDALGGEPACTLIGGGRSSPDRAALYNGSLVRYLDFLDSYNRQGEVCHPADNTAAILAVAEAVGADGSDFLTSLAVSYQVQCRLLDLPTMRAGVNYTTPLAFSVAAGGSRLLGMDADRTANALALAGVGAVSLAVIQAEPVSQWKGLASGEAASRAVHNTYLARAGITGDLGVFDGPLGLFQLVDGILEVDWETERLDAPLRTSIKKHNAEFQSQTAVDLAIRLRAEHGFEARAINRVSVEVAQGAYDVLGGGKYGPKHDCRIKEQADHNLLYLVAVALLDGEVWPPQFAPERITRDDVQTLLRKVDVQPSEDFTQRIPGELCARLTITFADGQVVTGEARDYDGYHTRPMSWDQVQGKFDRLTAGNLPDAGLRRAIAEAVDGLEGIRAKDLTGLLAQVGP
ncbi:MmgE/PrpD family protein [Methylobacterium sp. E-005]|uniref:MmgE/PrpD family protein n=1 Tax=Methylobacterium sp. E-005 TaxID=2836549 RepID=UPI001FB8FC31|nr:MmgE/PrpD family protein [Methylobacterium sp. E-005]MCJ2088495.1 MmgE/PrpD family protein [Methylobacterium sp. E-005]